MLHDEAMWYVYILECEDASLYVGATTDVSRRFREHQEGIRAKYTRAKGAKKILYTEEQPNRSAAFAREAQIKGWSRTKKLEFIERTKRAEGERSIRA